MNLEVRSEAGGVNTAGSNYAYCRIHRVLVHDPDAVKLVAMHNCWTA
jgi:hypothetical protein